MRRYNQLIFRTVRAVVRSDAEAEDVAQEAWLAAYRNLTQFEGRAAFATWLTRIAIRMALARTQKTTRFDVSAPTERTLMEAEADSPERVLQRRQLALALERAITALPVEHRLALVLRDVEQLSTADAAGSLGVSEENLRVRLHRARSALRELLQREFEDTMQDVFAFEGERCERMTRAVLARCSAEDV